MKTIIHIMDLRRGWIYGFIVVCFVLLYYSFELTGQASGGGGGGGSGTDTTCGPLDIEEEWNAKFTKLYDSTVRAYQNNETNCSSIIAYSYEIVDERILVHSMFGMRETEAPSEDNRVPLKGFEGLFQAVEGIFMYADYFETTVDQQATLEGLLSYSSAKEYLSSQWRGNGTGYISQEKLDEKEAFNAFKEVFKENIFSSLIDGGNGFNNSLFSVNSPDENATIHPEYHGAWISKTMPTMYLEEVTALYENLYATPFTEPIENHFFEVGNASYYAFDITNYVEFPTSLQKWGIYVIDKINENGTYVNVTTKGTKVYFEPNPTFKGWMRFAAYIEDALYRRDYSNVFNVTFIQEENLPPEFTGQIPDIIIPKQYSTTLLLKPFFTDPEGKRLTYQATPSQKVYVEFIGNVATISAITPFNGKESLQIYAFDESQRVASNVFGVSYEGGAPIETPLPPFEVNSTSTNLTEEHPLTPFVLNWENFKWVVNSLLFILVAGIIGIILWVYLRNQKQKAELQTITNQASANQVQEYIKQLEKD